MKRISAWFLIWMLSFSQSGCGSRQSENAAKIAGAKSQPAKGKEMEEDGETKKFSMKLRELPIGGDKTEIIATAEARPLSADQRNALLARLDTLKEDATDERVFSFRPSSAPPPRPGKTMTERFPQSENAPPPEPGKPGELEVLRFSPEGNVDLAPHLSVTFSKPMIAVTDAEGAASNVPISISPLPKGKWRALGTRTFMFVPDGRFPMATKYRVEIPAGIKSIGGDSMKSKVAFGFQTPPLKIEDAYPNSGEPQGLRPSIFIRFNQKIDPAEVMKSIALQSGDGEVPVVQLSKSELPKPAANGVDLRKPAEAALPDTWVAFQPISPLAKDNIFKVVLKKGAKSEEGPLKTRKPQDFSFQTYAPFKMTAHQCGWNGECPPTADWSIEFNNAIDPTAFDPKSIVIDPAAPNLTVDAWYRTIRISGQKNGRTKYKVTIPAALKDSFGQTLGKDIRLTFEVGPAEKNLFPFGRDIVTLDPSGDKVLPLSSVNLDSLKVEINRVLPTDFRSIQNAIQKRNQLRNRNAAPPIVLPGKEVFDGVVPISGTPDALNKTLIDFGPYLVNGFGQFVVRVRPGKPGDLPYLDKEGQVVWVQVTKIGITAFMDNQEMIVWTTALDRAAPLGNLDVALLGVKGELRTTADANGLSRISLPMSAKQGDILTAQQGSDIAMLPYTESLEWGGGGWNRVDEQDELLWFTFDDRGMYRPGETAEIKGWFRRIDLKKGGDVHAPDPMPTKVTWRLTDSQGNELKTGKAEVSRLGGFHFSVNLQKDMNLGTASLSIVADGAGRLGETEHFHYLEVQEFRRPEFEVTSSSDAGPFIIGNEAKVTVTASYYAGGGLPFAPVTWSAIATPAFFTPPGRDEFQFGLWNPWWFSVATSDDFAQQTLQTKTDGSGMHRIGISFEPATLPRPMMVKVEGQVTDVNQQAWTSSQSLLVHPSDRYVGIRLARGFVGKNDPIEADAIVVDLDGKTVSNAAATLTLARIESSYKNNQYKDSFMEESTCAVVSLEKPSPCVFHPKQPGVYRIRGTAQDEKGRMNVTDTRVWVEGAELPKTEYVDMEKLTLVPEKQTYQPGATASFMVQAPFYPAEGILTVRRSGIIKTEAFRMDGPTHVLSVPIVESHIPEIGVQVDLTGARPIAGASKGAPMRPAFASGSIQFKVPPLKRTLNVQVSAKNKVIAPGKKTVVDLLVKDANGRPVQGAETAIVVVDESVLALSGYRLPDPVAVFYAARGDNVSAYYLRSQVQASEPKLPGRRVMAETQAAMPAVSGGINYKPRASMPLSPMPLKHAVMKDGGALEAMDIAADGAAFGGGGGRPQPKIAARINFNALALFAPEVVTDKNGKARVSLTLPDSVTRYRIMAVAAANDKYFGMGEANITARLPLMVRPSAPRFLNFGDKFELPVVLQNQTDTPMTVDVAVRATNATLSGEDLGEGKEITIPPDNRAEVRFKAGAKNAGIAKFQIAATSRDFADAQTISIPVRTPATAEAFATYGEIDDGAILQEVQPPKNVWKEFGGLEITASSTELQALTDAVLYLVTYPFECAEQISSRILAVAALKDVLSAFAVEGMPSAETLARSVTEDLKELEKIQNRDGGFGFWNRGEPSLPYLTVHAAHAMAMAKAKGFEVIPAMWDKVFEYLKDIENRIPNWYDKESKRFIRGYAVFVMNKMGGNPLPQATALMDEAGVNNLPLEAAAWLLPTLKKGGKAELVSKLLRRFDNSATETAAGAHFVTSYTDGAQVLLHSDRRADGILLQALIDVAPKSDLIPKLVRGLLGHKIKGRWESTQENAFVLLALDSYFNVFEKITPNFTARAWLGDKLALDYLFKGRTVDRAHVDVPMKTVTEQKSTVPLVVDKAGKGRLYYRIGMRYAPKNLSLKPADFGFTVDRAYEPVDDPKDVKKDKNGVWHIKRGARVRVRVTMVTPMRRYHTALVDPMPAGLEPVNPALAVEGTVPDDPNAPKNPYWWWYRPWFEHQNLRDDRAEAFTSLLWEGVHEYTYVARATVPGTYVVPPAKAEEMYTPETFGRTGTDRVVVE